MAARSSNRMPAILKIGYNYFLCKTEAQAIAALKALSDAVQVDQGYEKGAGYVYYPTVKRGQCDGMELKIVQTRQLRKSKPDDEEAEPREVKLLDFNGKVNYQ